MVDANLEQAMESLGLESKFTKQKSKESLIGRPIKTVDNHNKRDREVLNQLLLHNPLALDVKTSGEQNILDRHILDVVVSIFMVSEEEVRETIAHVLVNSARALPLVLPFEKPELSLWPIQHIVKQWQIKGAKSFEEKRVYEYESIFVGFIKVGEA